MKLFAGFVLILSLAGLAFGFSDFIRAGQNSARNIGTHLQNTGRNAASSVENMAKSKASSGMGGLTSTSLPSPSNIVSSITSAVSASPLTSALTSLNLSSLMNSILAIPIVATIISYCKKMISMLTSGKLL